MGPLASAPSFSDFSLPRERARPTACMHNPRLVLLVAMLSRASAYMVGGGSIVARAAGRVHVRTMALKTGIVGLPNVGKSTLFNALMEESQAQAANFPFCTIEPNVGVVAVPDKKLAVLGEINSSEKLVPTSLSFVDIAGLVEGASKGEGLGNKFLANIRECDAIVHTVRCFVDDNVVHVSGTPLPLAVALAVAVAVALALSLSLTLTLTLTLALTLTLNLTLTLALALALALTEARTA